jgi:hypothetical protein
MALRSTFLHKYKHRKANRKGKEKRKKGPERDAAVPTEVALTD